MDTSSTDYSFDLNTPVPEVYAKIAWKPYSEEGEVTSDWIEESTEEKSPCFRYRRLNRAMPEQSGYKLSDLMHAFASQVRDAFLVSVLSLDLTRRSLYSSTRFYELSPAMRYHLEEKRYVLPPSMSLIMQRNNVQKTCLFAPSGALLTWMEMLGEKVPDGK